jgi:hypothetical protein
VWGNTNCIPDKHAVFHPLTAARTYKLRLQYLTATTMLTVTTLKREAINSSEAMVTTYKMT